MLTVIKFFGKYVMSFDYNLLSHVSVCIKLYTNVQHIHLNISYIYVCKYTVISLTLGILLLSCAIIFKKLNLFCKKTCNPLE